MEPQQKISPKDVFLHLLAIITLYASAISFLVLAFHYIDLAFPNPGQYLEGIRDSIRFSVSVLVVVFPVYLITSWFLNKSYLALPSRRDLRLRKWLIYLTLFIAALVVIGDLVALIYQLLGGGYTAPFLLKVIAVFFVAGSIFAYYFWDVRRYKTE